MKGNYVLPQMKLTKNVLQEESDVHKYVRYITRFEGESMDNADIWLTNHGKLKLISPYKGSDVEPGQSLIVLGRIIEKGLIQGCVKMIKNPQKFQQLVTYFQNRSSQNKNSIHRKEMIYSQQEEHW